jgi:2-(1,2-epoxy-1,2-dihydrophenyl)acetyl-CoA isomerase
MTFYDDLVQQLRATLEELVADRQIRTIVLTGADPAFSAGGDTVRDLLVGR